MAATNQSPKSSSSSARADISNRKRPSVDLSLIDAQLDELFAVPEEKISATEVSARADANSKTGVFRLLSHNQITVRPQVRQSFPEDEMMELRESIRNLHEKGQGIEGTGILQALIISPQENGFRLIAGERRFRASQDEKITLLPCVVIGTVSENSIRVLQLTENALRTPPPILEEARAIKDAMAAEKLSIRDMARVLGKDKSFVEGRINLLKYPIDVQEMVSARADTLRHARHLAGLEDDATRQQLIAEVRDEGIGEREVKRRISNIEAENNTKSNITEESSNKARTSKQLDETLLSHSLERALKVTGEVVERLRLKPLDKTEKEKARGVRESLRSILTELDNFLD